MVKIKIDDYLIIPFGSSEWDAGKISVAGIAVDALYLKGELPCVCIKKTARKPLRLNNIGDIFPETVETLILIDSPREALVYIRDCLKEKCGLQTKAQRRFLDLYFEKVEEQVTPEAAGEVGTEAAGLPVPKNRFEWCFYALLPLPQAHIGASEPPAGGLVGEGPGIFKTFKADFAFWTGKRLVAVDITCRDSFCKTKELLIKEKMLREAGVWFICIPEEKLFSTDARDFAGLLPKDVDVFWEGLTMEDFFPSPIKFLIKLF